MYDGELAEAHQTVPQLRAAKIRYFEGTRYTDGQREKMTEPPKNGFITSEDGEPLDLGTVIEIILDWLVRYGRLDEGGDDTDDLDPVNVGLEVTSPGFRAKVNFNTPCGLFWRLDYEWKSSEQLEFEAANEGKFASPAWPSRNGPYMWSSRTIGENSLWRIADCLRGYEMEDDLEEVCPPYDTSPQEQEAVPA